MSVQIKICGFSEPDSLRAAVALGIDWAGFTFVEKSPRFITPNAAANLLLHVGSTIPVALLVDPDDVMVDEIAALGFPVLQLHGSETPARVEEIKSRTGCEIWKAVGVSSAVNLDDACQYSGADRLLLDAKPPKTAQITGGHGAAFDWRLLNNWQAPKPWMLAGGLNPENVAEAIAVTGTRAVDVSSGVERIRGLKSAQLIKKFVEAVREHSA